MQQLIGHITKKASSFSGTIEICGSKSLSNRMLIIRELSENNCTINNLSTSNDTYLLSKYLKKISTCHRSNIPMVIDAKDAGTVARFLTAYLVFHEGKWLVTGSERMNNRPMKGIVDGLTQIGGIVNYKQKKGFLPIQIIGTDVDGGIVDIDVSKSSQFASALMLIAPYLDKGIDIRFSSKPVSAAYFEMTGKLMQKYGAHVEIKSNSIKVLPGKYEFHPSTVESDWSSASYWYELVALSENSEITIKGLSKNSLQGDSIISSIFDNFGVSTTFSAGAVKIKKEGKPNPNFKFDFENAPDIVPAVMSTCAALNIDAEFINIHHLAYKESDRIASLKSELQKIGAIVTKVGNSYKLKYEKKSIDSITFSTHNDHRLAMCLAPLVLMLNKVSIENPNVVNKSYPEFWDDFKKLNFANLVINNN